MQADQIDRLAEFCRLEEKGYWKAATYWDGELLREQWHKDGRAWNPFDSDDDCRVVLEECRQRGMMNDVDDAMWTNFMNSDIEQHGLIYGGWLMLATPAEKCEAVLKVLGETNDHASD